MHVGMWTWGFFLQPTLFSSSLETQPQKLSLGSCFGMWKMAKFPQVQTAYAKTKKTKQKKHPSCM